MPYIAMNRFKVRRGSEAEFEQIWLGRDSHLSEVPGFVEFQLLRGPEREDHVLYASHTVWADEGAFQGWLKSEAFRKAHAGAGETKATYLEAPEFEGFVSLQRV